MPLPFISDIFDERKQSASRDVNGYDEAYLITVDQDGLVEYLLNRYRLQAVEWDEARDSAIDARPHESYMGSEYWVIVDLPIRPNPDVSQLVHDHRDHDTYRGGRSASSCANSTSSISLPMNGPSSSP